MQGVHGHGPRTGSEGAGTARAPIQESTGCTCRTQPQAPLLPHRAALSLLGSNCSPTLLFKSRFLSNLTSLCALPASLPEAEELLPSSSLAEHTEVHPKGRRPKHFTLISRDCSKEKPFVSRKSVHTHSGHCWVSNSYSEHLAGSGEDKNKHTSNPQVLPIVPFCQKMFLAQKQLHKSTDGRITAKIYLFVSSGRCPYGISAYPKLTCTAPAS